MKRKKLFSLILAVLMMMSVLTACGGSGNSADGEEASGSKDESYISIATGGTGGTYYPLGGAMATVLNNADIGIQANAQSTGASIENVELIHNGDAEIAFIQNDVAYYAFNGEEFFDADKQVEGSEATAGVYDDLRGICCVYPEVVHIIASDDSGIKTVEDLKGKRVAVGAPGSSTEVNGRQIVEAYGLSYDDFSKTDYLSFAESADQIKNGQIDAAFATTGVPTSSITELATTYDVHFLPVDINKLSQYPYYSEMEIPQDAYKGMTEPVKTVAVKAMLVVNESMSEETVYNITKALFENLDTIADAHARGKDLQLDTALEGMSIEVHPGAQKYYDEQGK
jgi:TRAP transporter TAXI family solute receptor